MKIEDYKCPYENVINKAATSLGHKLTLSTMSNYIVCCCGYNSPMGYTDPEEIGLELKELEPEKPIYQLPEGYRLIEPEKKRHKERFGTKRLYKIYGLLKTESKLMDLNQCLGLLQVEPGRPDNYIISTTHGWFGANSGGWYNSLYHLDYKKIKRAKIVGIVWKDGEQ